MSLFRLFFPAYNRTFRGKRWVRIIFRSFHIYGIAMVVGGTFFAVPVQQLTQFYLVTILSGLGLILIDIYTNGIWLIQNRGWIILLKVVVFANLSFFGSGSRWVLILLLFVSGIISHTTANQRYYSLYHRKRVDRL